MTHDSSRRTRRLRRAATAVTASAFLAVSAVAAMGANPPEPTYAPANVDGNASEWNLADDFFSDMIRAGGNGGQTEVESKLYMRYDCAAKVAYALVLAEPGVTILSDAAHAADNHIKFGLNNKQVDASDGDDGTAPDFHYIGSNGTTATGWEASFPLVEGVYSDLNVHTQVDDGGSQTSAVPGRSIPLTVACPEVLPPLVSKTATTSYTRTYDWSVVKTATPAQITTTQDTAQFTYTVDVTKTQVSETNFAVSGTISVHNQNAFPITVTVTDEVAPGTDCPLTGASNVDIAANGTLDVPYSCDLASKTDGTNQAAVSFNQTTIPAKADYAFGAPTTVINDTVDVMDSFNNGLPVLIPGGQGISASTTFTYTRDVGVPVAAGACTTYPNIATITSPDELFKQSSAQVQACREPATTGQPTPPTTLPAVIRVTKRGATRARAGQVITYTIVVRNTSAQAASNVILRDVLPGGFSFYRVPKGASLVKGRMVWKFGTLAPGARKIVRVQIRADRRLSGRRCNTAIASAANAGTVKSRACTVILRVAGVARVPVVTG